MIQPVREGAAADAALVAAALAGDGLAFASLFDGWFERCFDVAFRIVRNRDIAAEVAQEVFLGAWRELASLRDHTAFGGWVLRASRNRALNRLEKERRTVALGDEATTTAIDAAPAPDAAAEALSGSGADLIWAAASALGDRDASILDLHLRHGMAAPELAEALGVTSNNAHQLLFRLRGKLADAIRASVLWHQGRPSCPELQDALHRAGLGPFGPEAAKVAQRHAEGCERCGERQRSALSPEALFAGIPLVVAGPQLRARVISSLRGEGVPVGTRPVPAAPPAGGTSALPLGGAQALSDTATSGTRVRRPGVLVSAVLAALLLAGGAAVALRGDRPPAGLGAPVLASLAAGPSTTAAPSSSAPIGTVGSVPPGTGPAPVPITPRSTGAPAPTTTSTTSGSTSSTAAGRPVIERFTAALVSPSRLCTKDEQQVRLTWTTSGTESVTLTGPAAPAKAQLPSASADACAPLSTAAPVYVLTATGPGGVATAKASA